jgi:tRNA (Thr-GGU) A37 N-methylase
VDTQRNAASAEKMGYRQIGIWRNPEKSRTEVKNRMSIWKKLKRRIEVRPEFQTVEADRLVEEVTEGKMQDFEDLVKEVERHEEILREMK